MAASLALHAVALFSLPGFVDTARRAAAIPPQLIARLMEAEPQVQKPAPVPPPPAAQPEKPVAKKAVKPAPRQIEAPVARERIPAPAPVPEQPVVQEPVETPPLAAVEPAPAAAPARTAPTAQAPEALSRDQYRVQLIDEARRHKRYPPLARENNWQGDVRVAVALAANGQASVTLRGSSGYEVLDRQALEMFTRAARTVPVPPALRGKEFSLEVRAVYGLED